MRSTNNGYGWNKIETEKRVYFNWQCAAEGIYFVRAWNLSGAVGKDTEYELRVYKPEAPLLGTIAGSVLDSKTRSPLTGVKVWTNGGQTGKSQKGEYLIAHPEGTYTLSAEATGYKAFTDSVSVAEGEIVIKNISMVAKTTSTIPITISSSSTTSRATTSIPQGSSSSTSTQPRSSSTTTSATASSTSSSTTTSSATSSSTSSSTTTTTRQRLCPVQQIAGSENSPVVRVFRQYRDRQLAKSAEGLVGIYLYYSHAPELSRMFAADPQLAAQAKALMTQVLPAVEQSLTNHARITLSRAQYREACKLMVQIQRSASPRLQQTLGVVMYRLAVISDPLSPVKIQLAD